MPELRAPREQVLGEDTRVAGVSGDAIVILDTNAAARRAAKSDVTNSEAISNRPNLKQTKFSEIVTIRSRSSSVAYVKVKVNTLGSVERT